MAEETYKLSVPIKTHKGEISELTLQPPKGRSFLKHGQLVKDVYSGPRERPEERKEEHTFNFEAVYGFLVDMTGHDRAILEGLEAYDVQQLAYVVLGMISIRPQ